MSCAGTATAGIKPGPLTPYQRAALRAFGDECEASRRDGDTPLHAVKGGKA